MQGRFDRLASKTKISKEVKTMPKRNKGTGNIYYREDRKVYEGRIQVGRKYNGKPIFRFVTKKRKTDVQKELIQIKAQLDKGIYFEPSNTPLRIWMYDWMEAYMRDSIKQQTYVTYELMIRTKIVPLIGHVKIQNLTPLMVQQAFNELAKQYSPATLQKVKSILRMALRKALDNELIIKDPMRGLKLPKLLKPQIEIVPEKDVSKLIKAAKGHNVYEVVATGLGTGMRIGEMLALDWADIDLKRAEVTVHKTLVRLKDDNNKEILKVQFIPKTECGLRTVPLSRENVELLKKLKRKRLTKGFYDNGIVFCSTKGKRMHPRNFNRDLESICKKAGIKRISANVTRHTFASTAIARGAECKTVSEILGHKDVTTTLNNYVHPSKEKMKEVAEMVTISSF